MSAYIVAMVDVTDWDKYKEYMAKTPDAIAKYGGKFIARGGEKVVLEGEDDGRRVVLLEFPSMDKVKEFYNSEEYQSAKKLREGAATGLFIGLDGV